MFLDAFLFSASLQLESARDRMEEKVSKTHIFRNYIILRYFM